MNTDKLMELLDEVLALQSQHYGNGAMTHMELSEWASKARRRLAALRAEQAVGEEQIAREMLAEELDRSAPTLADQIRSGDEQRNGVASAAIRAIRRALGAARQPENIGEFVIALLIAGGYVTQAKVDEARKIALGHGPYEMPARQSEGMVFGVTKVERDFRWDGDKQHHVPLLTVEFDPVLPTDGYDAKGWKDRDALATLLAAAPGGEGEVDRG